MSNQSITYLVGACLGVLGLAAFCALVIVPAITSYRRLFERVAVVVLSMYVLAALVGVGHHHRRALLQATTGRGRADARAGGGGDDDDLAGEQRVPGRGRGRGRWIERRLEAHATPFGSGGRPSTRSPMMFRCIWLDPP